MTPLQNGTSKRRVQRRQRSTGAVQRLLHHRAPPVREVLAYVGETSSPTRMAPARGLPLWEMADAGQDKYRIAW
jgi:hypothetical protein